MNIQNIADAKITTVETDIWDGGLYTVGLIFNAILPILLIVFIVYVSFRFFKILKGMNNTLNEINKNLQD